MRRRRVSFRHLLPHVGALSACDLGLRPRLYVFQLGNDARPHGSKIELPEKHEKNYFI
jgi:hypothetical protein